MSGRRGITLLELLVAVAVFAGLIAGLYAFSTHVLRGDASMEARAEGEDEINRLLMVVVKREFDAHLQPVAIDPAPYVNSFATVASAGFSGGAPPCFDLDVYQRNLANGTYETVSFRTSCTTRPVPSSKPVHPQSTCSQVQSQIVVTRMSQTGTELDRKVFPGAGRSAALCFRWDGQEIVAQAALLFGDPASHATGTLILSRFNASAALEILPPAGP